MSPTPSIVVGVDAGGSVFRALVLDGGGAELARQEAPSARVLAGAPEPVVEALRALIGQACLQAGVALPVSAVWAGIAGAGRESVRAELESALAHAGVARRVGVGTDVEAAFEDAFGSGSGILLMSGTGSIALGRAEDGREGRVGGWGSVLGDEGSGYAIGVDALKRVARSHDGRARPTALTGRLLTRLGLAAPDELITWAASAPRPAIAALVPEVEAAAAEGDMAAGEILSKAVEDLEGHVLTVLQTLGPWQGFPTVALGGGLLQKGGPLRPPVEHLLQLHNLPFLGRDLDPARGAAQRALAL